MTLFETIGKARLPGEPRRPKILERRPDPSPVTSFEIEEDKLRSALPPPTSSVRDDIWALTVFGSGAALFLIVIVLILNVFFRFLPAPALAALIFFGAGLFGLATWLLRK